jgi:hypothetical protein
VERGLADHEGVLVPSAVGILERWGLLSVVLRRQRFAALADLRSSGDEFPDYVADGIDAAEAFANGEDPGHVLGLFEWSAPPGCAKDDVDGILQANPSIGHGVDDGQADAIADIRGMTDADYRTEVLCQWVTARVNSFIDKKDFVARHVPGLLSRTLRSGFSGTPGWCGVSTRRTTVRSRGCPRRSAPPTAGRSCRSV